MTWAVQGAGSISADGLYQAPSSMPATSIVTVTATSASSSSVSAAYQFSLVNPIPAIYNAYTAQGVLLPGTTNSTTISGGNFTPDSTVLVNGNPVATAYQSATILIAQIPVPMSTQGSVPITVQNPAPAGGMSAVYLKQIANLTLKLNSLDATGLNPSTVPLGLAVQFTSAVQGSGSPATVWPVKWSVQGAGTISPAGLYTAPPLMPSTQFDLVTATLADNSSISASYQLWLINPIPVINSSTPTHLLSGMRNSVTLGGRGFVPSTRVLVNGRLVQASYQSDSRLQISIDLKAGDSGFVNLIAQNPEPNGNASEPFSIVIASPSEVSAHISVTPGRTIPDNFLGMAHEWGEAEWYLGSSATGVNQIYRQLLTILMGGDTYPFLIRIGGNTTDATTAPMSVVSFAELATAMHVHFSLGVNLAANNLDFAMHQAQSYAQPNASAISRYC